MVSKHHQQPGNMSPPVIINTVLFMALLRSVGCVGTIQFEVNGYNITFDPDTFSQFFDCLQNTSYQCNVTFAHDSTNENELNVSNTTVKSDPSQYINDSLYFKCPAPTRIATQHMFCTRSILDATPTYLDPSTCSLITYHINKDPVYKFGIIFYDSLQNLKYSITHTLAVEIQPCFSNEFNTSSQVDQTLDDDFSITISTDILITEPNTFLLASNSMTAPNAETPISWSPSTTSATLGYVTWTTYYDSGASVSVVSVTSPSLQSSLETTTSNNVDNRETLTFSETSTSVIDSRSAAMMTDMDVESSDVQSSLADCSTVGLDPAPLVTHDERLISSMEIEQTVSIDFTSVITQGPLVTTPNTITSPHSTDALTTLRSLESTSVPTHTALTMLDDSNVDTLTSFSSSASTFLPTPPLYTTPNSIETPLTCFISSTSPTSSEYTKPGSTETPSSSLTSTSTSPTPPASKLTIDVPLPNVFPSPMFPWNKTEAEPTPSTPNWSGASITATIEHISVSENATALTGRDLNTDRNKVRETGHTSSFHSMQSIGNETEETVTTITVPSNNPNTTTYASSISFYQVPVIAGTVVGVALLACIVMICYILVKKRKRDQIKKRSQRFKGLKDNYEMIKTSPVHGVKPSASPSKPQNGDSKPRKGSQPAESSNKINPAPRKFSDPGPQSKPDDSNRIALKPLNISPVKDQTIARTNENQSDMGKNALQVYLGRSDTLLPEVDKCEGTRESASQANGIGDRVQPGMEEHLVNFDIETDSVNLHSYAVNSSTNTVQSPSSTISQLKPGEGRSASNKISNRLNVDVLIAGLENSINKKNNLIKTPGRRVVEKQPSDDGSGYSTISVMDAGNMSGLQKWYPEFIARDGEKLKAEDAESVYSTVMWEDVSANTLPNFNFGSSEADDDGYTTVDSDSIGQAGGVIVIPSSNDRLVSLGQAGGVIVIPSSNDRLVRPLVEEPETGERPSVGGLYTTVDLQDDEEEVTPRLNRSKDRFNINNAKPKHKLNNYSVIWPRHVQSDHLGSPANQHKPVLFAGNTLSEMHPGATHGVYSTLHAEARWHQNPYSTILDLKKQHHFQNGIESREKSAAGDVKHTLQAGSAKFDPAKRNYTLINIGSENGEGHATSVKVTQIQEEKTKLAEHAKGEEVTPEKSLSGNSFDEKENVYFELERVTEDV